MNSCPNYLESWGLFWTTFVSVFLPWLVAVLFLSTLLYSAYRYTSEDKASERGWLIFSFVALGAMVGITAGASKTPVLGTFLPAFLTFISGVLGYLFSKDSLVEWRKVIPFCMIGMLLASILNVFTGAAIKGEYQKFEREYEVWLLEKENQIEVQKAILLQKAKEGKEIIYHVAEKLYECK